VFWDNQSTIHLTKNQMYHEKTKHVDVRYYFLRRVMTQHNVRLTESPIGSLIDRELCLLMKRRLLV
jgi:hypothetical protein